MPFGLMSTACATRSSELDQHALREGAVVGSYAPQTFRPSEVREFQQGTYRSRQDGLGNSSPEALMHSPSKVEVVVEWASGAEQMGIGERGGLAVKHSAFDGGEDEGADGNGRETRGPWSKRYRF